MVRVATPTTPEVPPINETRLAEVDPLAGKRQHYVPRLLQRGFLDGPAGGAERTWLHRPGEAPRLVGIKDVGVEDWFYSRRPADGTPTLDDSITDHERDLSRNVNALRSATPGAAVDAAVAAETVVHLVLRAAHLRRLATSGITTATDELVSLITSAGRLGAMLGVTGPAMSQNVIDAIGEHASELIPTGIPRALSERMMTFMVREMGDQVVEQAAATLGPMLSAALGDYASRIRETHNEVLEKPLDENGWVAALQELAWSVEAATDLILPDAVALSRAQGATFEPLLFTTAAEADAVLMPISHGRMLVGRRGDATVDLSRFNEAAAAGSEAFFIAARPLGAELGDLIGTGPATLLAASIAGAVRDAEAVRSLGTTGLTAARPREIEQAGFSYRVTLADFGDEVLAQEYAAILQSVVAMLAREMPLHTLDAVVIAANYDRALAGVDRGDPALPPVTSGALGYGVGVAKPVSVLRDGETKQELVVAAGLADGWTSSDETVRAASLHTLVVMLAGIAEAARYADGHATRFKPDAIGRELHLAVARAPSEYWSAQRAAFVHPDEGETYATLVIDSLDYADREIAAARSRMADQTDIDESVSRAIECLGAVLGHAADWLGHRAGVTEGRPFAGDDLPDRLGSRGLGRWLELFGRDLAACYPPDGTLDLEAVTSLSRHVERLLWAFGVYCWLDGEGMRCVVTDQPLTIPAIGAGDLAFGAPGDGASGP